MTKKGNRLMCLFAFIIVILCNFNYIRYGGCFKMEFLPAFLGATFDYTTMFRVKSVVFTMENLAMIELFLILFGKCFCNTVHGPGIYCLIRQRNRSKWLYKNALELFLLDVIYVSFYVVGIILLSIRYSNHLPQGKDFVGILVIFFALCHIIFFIGLLTNFLCVIWGEVIGYIFGSLILFMLVWLCLHSESILILRKNVFLRYINPTYCVTLYVDHLSKYANIAVITAIVEDSLLLLIGKKVIERMDIFGYRKEVEG